MTIVIDYTNMPNFRKVSIVASSSDSLSMKLVVI